MEIGSRVTHLFNFKMRGTVLGLGQGQFFKRVKVRWDNAAVSVYDPNEYQELKIVEKPTIFHSLFEFLVEEGMEP